MAWLSTLKLQSTQSVVAAIPDELGIQFPLHRGKVLFLFSCSVMSNSLRPHGLQHAKLPCPSPIPGLYSNSCPLSRWFHPTISSSVIPFSSCLQSFPASGSFQMSQFFASGGQSIGVSASTSVLPMTIQDWFPLGWTGWISISPFVKLSPSASSSGPSASCWNLDRCKEPLSFYIYVCVCVYFVCLLGCTRS